MKEIIKEAILLEVRGFIPILFADKISSLIDYDIHSCNSYECINCLNHWEEEKIIKGIINPVINEMKEIPRTGLAQLLSITDETMVHKWSIAKVENGHLTDFKRRYKRFYKLLHTDDPEVPFITFTPRISELDTPFGKRLIKDWISSTNTLIYERYLLMRTITRDRHKLHMQDFFKYLPKKLDDLIRDNIISFLFCGEKLAKYFLVLDDIIKNNDSSNRYPLTLLNQK